jgi:cholest-4-en-3-one 26-monooxygenase
VLTTQIDLTDARFVEGVPHETLALLRCEAPLWWWPEAGCWVVTAHRLVEAMNRDFETYSSEGGIIPPGLNINPSVLLAMDPPVHTEYRRMVIKSFVPRAIASIEQDVRAIADAAVADFVAAGGGDFITDIASAIPYRVMADLTGVPREAESKVMGWGNAIAPNTDPEYRPTPDAAIIANDALNEFLGEELEKRRRNPGTDLMSNLLAARHQDGSPLSEADMRGFALNYLLGGTETTRNLIGNAMHELLVHPDQLRRFVDGEVDAATMTEELLRWITPVMQHSRWPTRDAEVEGQLIRKGDRVTLWMVSANRDPEAFDRPDEFDIGRNPNHHVALGGGGPHYCLGAHLARLETIATFEALRPHLTRLAFAAPAERVASNFINGMKHLRLSVTS